MMDRTDPTLVNRLVDRAEELMRQWGGTTTWKDLPGNIQLDVDRLLYDLHDDAFLFQRAHRRGDLTEAHFGPIGRFIAWQWGLDRPGAHNRGSELPPTRRSQPDPGKGLDR